MNRNGNDIPRFPCHIYEIEDAGEAHKSFRGELIKEYGDDVRLENGQFLHGNYMWDEGSRNLVRCRMCGGLLIKQYSEFHSFSDSPDGYYEDWIPVASEKEADLLNILLSEMEMENVPCRHIRGNNGDIFWTEGDEPEAFDPEALIQKIREKYAETDPEHLEELIRKAGAETGTEDEEDIECFEEYEEDESDDSIPVRIFYTDETEEIRREYPECEIWTLIMDRTEDKDLQEIQKMAAVLDAFLRTEDIGFGDVHLRIENDPEGDVSWEPTEDGYALHLCAESGRHWCQTAYQLGYLMTRCLIDHMGKGKPGVSWAEELISEAAALELLRMLKRSWELTPFREEDPEYFLHIGDYIEENLSDMGTSAILRCRDKEELKIINERNLFEDRLDESHNLFRTMVPGDLLELVQVREYEADNLLLYTHYWRGMADDCRAVDYLCRLQEKIPGCEMPAGISQEINLENAKPTEAQRQTFGQMIRALRDLPLEYAEFFFLDEDKGDKEQIGLVYYRVSRNEDGTITAGLRLDTRNGRRVYVTTMDEDGAIAILERILKTNEVPDVAGWDDISELMFSEEE